MDRRNFINFTLASLGLMMVPSTFVAAQEISSAKELTEAMEKLFKCKVGAPGPYVDFDVNQKMALGVVPPEDAWKYLTFIFCLEGDDAKASEKRLSQYFYERFKVFADKKPDLYWRVKPEFERKEIFDFGDVFASLEDYEDHKIELPQNVAFDFHTGNYRYYNNKFWLNRIRTRLAIPEVLSINSFAITEGARAKRI